MRARAGLGRLALSSRARLLARRTAMALLPLALLAGLDAFWIEPRRVLLRHDVRIEAGAPLRIVHLSDLHVERETALLRKLVAGVAAAQPDLVVISGDLVRDTPRQGPLARHTAALATLVSELRRTAPVFAVQGHSEHQGRVIVELADAGISWLSNEGALVGPGGRALLLGLNQQVGRDALIGAAQSPFRPVRRREGWTYGAVRGLPYRNFYSHYDPVALPEMGADERGLDRLADPGGPLAWSGYDLLCDVRIEDEETAVGVTAHSRYVLGEDRMIRLIRDSPDAESPRGFFLTAQGTVLAGDLETGVEPEPGRWYRLRLRTEVMEGRGRVAGKSSAGGVSASGGIEAPGGASGLGRNSVPGGMSAQGRATASGTVSAPGGMSSPGVVRILARVWPADEAEPREWQVRAEDRSRYRLTAGTAGLWAAGGGTALYRDLRVTRPSGEVLLTRSLAGRERPEGFRDGARGTRIAMALARSPRVPPGTPRIVLSHTPDSVLEAAWRGLDVVLAGHTHGGQVRIPLLGPLTTRSRLGPFYDRGLFAFAAPNPRGWTWLHVEPGIGTSLAPVRFWCPPSWTVIESGPQGARFSPVPR